MLWDNFEVINVDKVRMILFRVNFRESRKSISASERKQIEWTIEFDGTVLEWTIELDGTVIVSFTLKFLFTGASVQHSDWLEYFFKIIFGVSKWMYMGNI